MIFESVFFFRLFSLAVDKFCHELWLDFPDGTLEIISWFLLLSEREHSFFERVESNLHYYVGLRYPIVCCILIFRYIFRLN